MVMQTLGSYPLVAKGEVLMVVARLRVAWLRMVEEVESRLAAHLWVKAVGAQYHCSLSQRKRCAHVHVCGLPANMHLGRTTHQAVGCRRVDPPQGEEVEGGQAGQPQV